MPIAEVQLPDGRIAELEVPEGATEQQIVEFAQSQFSQGTTAAPEESDDGRGFGEEALRTLGRGARYGVEGLAAIPNLLAQPIVSGVNAASDALGAEPVFQPNQAQALSQALTGIGLPEDETAGERITGDVARALSAGGGLLGVAQRLQGPIAGALSQAPGLQAVGEVAGGASAGVAREAGAGPVAQTTLGLLGGVGAPISLQAGGALARSARNTARGVAENVRQLAGQRTPGVVEEFAGSSLPRSAERRLRSAERLDEQITPAEATGDPILAARQGAAGTSDEGARRLVEFGEQRMARQGETVEQFLDDLSSSTESAANEIRASAKKIIRQQQDALSDKAAPIYKKAFESSVDDETARGLLSDPVLGKYAKEVRQSPLYQTEIGRVQGQSEKLNYITGITGRVKKVGLSDGLKGVRFWDLVKRRIDDEIESAMRSGERNRARILEQSRQKVVQSLDSVSDDYAAARAIYGEGAKPLQAIRESAVGRIANLNDDKLKRVSKTLFDPSETDPQVLGKLRDNFIKDNPDAWRRVIRNEIERRLDSVKGERTGSTFYNTILSKDRDFRMFLNATKGMPEVRKTLIDMRRVWKDLINPESVKGAAGKAKSSLDVPRSSVEAAVNFIKNNLGAQADRAAVELITSPNWADEVKRIAQIDSKRKREQSLLEMIIQIGANTRPVTQGAAIGASAAAPEVGGQ